MAETTIGFEPPVIVLDGAIEQPLTDIASYRAVGGYAQLERARAMSPHDVTDQLIQSNLRGRGGAFFPTGRKASFIPTPDKVAKPIYLTVNADESEPGTFKDREIMLRVPHRLIEGCLIAAHAIQSRHVFIYIRGEYSREYEVLAAALEEARGGRAARRRRADDPSRRRRVHLRRGDGAARVARGQARAAAVEAAVPRDPGSLRVADADQQRRDDHERAEGARARAAGVLADRRAAGLDRHARVLPLRQRRRGRARTRRRTASRCAI